MKAKSKSLEALGLRPGMRVLPPRVVKYLSDLYCIDVDD